MNEQPKEHCDHECVCHIFRKGSLVALYDRTPCMRNHEGCKTCEYDTRSHPAPAPEGHAEHWTAVEERKQHDAAIARKAREDVLDELSRWSTKLKRRDYGLMHDCFQNKLESLREGDPR